MKNRYGSRKNSKSDLSNYETKNNNIDIVRFDKSHLRRSPILKNKYALKDNDYKYR